MTIILFLFLILLFLLLFASSMIFSLIRWILSLFGLAGRGSHRHGRQAGAGTYNAGGNTSSSSSGWHYSPEAEYKRRKRKKIIQQDEGEYVDYEEVKK